MSEKRKRGLPVKPLGLVLIEKKMREKGYSSREQLAEAAGLSPDTVQNLFHPDWGNNPQRKTIEAIVRVLDLDPADIVDDWYPPHKKPQSLEAYSSRNDIDWQKVCHDMLEEQRQNQRLRRKVTDVGCELNVHVPLGLVERKHQPRRGSVSSFSAEQGSGFFQLSEEEIIQTYDHQQFLEQVIQQGRSKSQGKRIAIVGEPGAGKTTLLEATAFYKEIPGLPILISLGSLGEKSLEEYLSHNWLKDALKTTDVTEQHKELEKLFTSGKVWLLLDGVDEMPANSPVEALAKIREELTGWIGKARVVLTCRQNVWDANLNSLQGFDVYRTLTFSYGDDNNVDQVKEFICQWFSQTDKPELGKPLREKLDEERHQRLRDLVKNPLRLSLLCQSWYFRQGDLAKTKAALYEQFTQVFYEWKQEQLPTTLTIRKELNAVLGLLAREAIDKEKSRFGIRESFALEVMGEDQFNLACKLHWLNFVYKDAETNEKVYVFFHPTFQEYFAACAIPDWNFFLNHNNENPNPFLKHNGKDCVYRIFEPQWKEVILLWLGRPEKEVPQEQKKEFIEALVKFNDGCPDQKFYWYRACFLAATGIAEFKDCRHLADAIVKQIVIWACSKQWWSSDPLSETARQTLRSTDKNIAIDALLQILRTNQNELTCLLAATGLLEIDCGHQEAITTLTKLMQYSRFEPIEWLAASVLLSIFPDHSKATEKLAGDLAYEDHKKWLRTFYENSETIATLINMLCSKDKSTCLQAAQNLMKIKEVRQEVGKFSISNLISIIINDKDEFLDYNIANILGSIAFKNQDAINFLIQLIVSPEENDGVDKETLAWLHIKYIENLGKISEGNLDSINALNYVMCNHFSKETRYTAAINLGKISSPTPEIILCLIEFISTGCIRENQIYYSGIKLYNPNDLWYKGNDFYEQASELLYAATKIISTDLSKGNWYETIIKNLNICLKEDVDEQNCTYSSRYEHCYRLIWNCAQNMSYTDFYQAWHEGEPSIVQPLENQFIHLQPTDKTYPIAINTQSLKLETNTSIIAQKLCNKIYRKAGYFEIPSVNDSAQLQQEISRIQQKLHKPNLALILHGCEPHEELINLCYTLADKDLGIYICLLTSKPTEEPIKGILPNQPNLLSAIQSWIEEIG